MRTLPPSLLVAVGSLLVPAWAVADISVDESEFHRANEDNDADSPAADAGDPRREDPSGELGGINLDECQRAEVWRLQVSWSGLSGNTLYVYSGQNCDTKGQRDGEGDDCVLMETIPIASDSTDTRDLEYGANEIANYPGTSCEDLDANLRVWFVVLEAAGDDNAVASTAFPSGSDIRVKTTLPTAPSNLSTGPGEEQVEVDWDGATEGQKYYVLCSPMPGAQGAVSPNPTFDGAGQEICIGDPPTDGFEAGGAMDRTWRCDQAGSDTFFATGTATESITIDGLTNDVQYFFSAVALDEVDNPSVLSELACSTPKPVTDFFELYRESGGQGGGGVCTATPGRPAGPGSPLLLLGLVAALGFALALRRRGAGVLLVVASLGVPALAGAQSQRYLRDEYASPQHFAFELRAGPYYPDVDGEFDGAASPFRDTFDTHDRLRLGFEVDWQIVHTPVGSVGVGGAASLMRYVGTSRFEGSGEKSSEETTLNVMPFVVSAVVRFDFAMKLWQIPLVPYGKAGFATYLWFAEDGDGTARADPDGPGGEGRVLGSGRTHGLELAGGLAFLLDFIEPGAARKFDADSGVNHSYVFFEVLWANVDGLGGSNVMTLSDTTWNAGLLLEI